MLTLRELWIVHPEREACAALEARFTGLPNVRVHAARFADLPAHDAFVTAGNAYGIMTAGIDAAVVARLGEPLMRHVQRHIIGHYLGEQPIGTAFLAPTGDPWCPWLVHTPTMRLPGSIAGTDAVYRATWAALLALHQHRPATDDEPPIEVVAMPAMGCGFGGMSFDESARQMAAAYQHALRPPTSLGTGWDLPLTRERLICFDGETPRARR